MLAGALFEYFPGDIGPRVIQAATVTTLLLAAWGDRANRSRMTVSLAIMLIMCIVVVLGFALDMAGLNMAHLLILLCFLVWVTWQSWHQVFFTGAIDLNKIIGAICIYLLMGLIWAVLYLFIAENVPDSFNGLVQAPWLENLATATYFSFVTITTLGYGDIVPIAPASRSLATLQAVVGQLYLTVIVARLVGLHVVESTEPSD